MNVVTCELCLSRMLSRSGIHTWGLYQWCVWESPLFGKKLYNNLFLCLPLNQITLFQILSHNSIQGDPSKFTIGIPKAHIIFVSVNNNEFCCKTQYFRYFILSFFSFSFYISFLFYCITFWLFFFLFFSSCIRSLIITSIFIYSQKLIFRQFF